jgi:hypothetical protein
MLRFDESILIPVMIFSIPIVAIVGGIISGIVKTLGRQRLVELAARERIAAIERGVDPTKLPLVTAAAVDTDDDAAPFPRPGGARRRAQGLLIGGVVTLFTGVGVTTFLMLLDPNGGEPVWAAGLVPSFVGAGLLLSAWLVWPRGDEK